MTFCQCLDGRNIGRAATCPVDQMPMRNYVKLEASYAWTPMLGNLAGLVPGSPLAAVLFVRTQ